MVASNSDFAQVLGYYICHTCICINDRQPKDLDFSRLPLMHDNSTQDLQMHNIDFQHHVMNSVRIMSIYLTPYWPKKGPWFREIVGSLKFWNQWLGGEVVRNCELVT